MSRQLLLSKEFTNKTEHGGEYSTGKRKTARPICTRRAMHLVLRSTMATGRWSMLRPEHARFIRESLGTLSRRCDVRVYEFANSGNHLHLLLRAKHRRGFQSFLRRFAGLVALKMSGGVKGKPLPRRFWDLPAFSRIVEWGRAFKLARNYVVKNVLEAMGVVPYRVRAHRGNPNKQNRTAPS